ncbi:RNA polymerase sigma factor, partial [Cellulomonas sp. NPDC055163]
MTTIGPADVARVFREEHARAVAVLTRVPGGPETQEGAVEGAFVRGVGRWLMAGMPVRSEGWRFTTA